MRRLLSRTECVLLRDLWLEAHAVVEGLRQRPMGESLRRVPVPTRLSESLVALEAPRILDADAPATSGSNGSDLMASIGGRPTGIAVKGGASGWVSITRSDRLADLLVWLDFEPLLRRQSAAIEVYVFRVADFASVGDRLLLRAAPMPYRRINLRFGRTQSDWSSP